MSPHPASFDSLGREDAQQGMQDDTEELSPRDATYDRTGDSLWKDGQESSSRQGPSGNARTSASSPAFPAAREDGDSMTAAEAAKLRLFKALRTAKACDICKISKTTRKKLLSMSENNARNGQSVIPKNPRGRPMTTDIGSWVIKDSDSQSTRPGEPGVQQPDQSLTSTKRRKHSSESPRQYSGEFPSGIPSGSTMPIPFPPMQYASSSRYPASSQDAGKDMGSYALSNTRSSFLESEAPFGPMQFLTDQDVGKRLDSRRSPRARDDVTTSYATIQTMDSGPTTTDIASATPSSLQATSTGITSSHTTQSTPASGSTQARPIAGAPLYDDARGLHGDVHDFSQRTDHLGRRLRQYGDKSLTVYRSPSSSSAEVSYGVRYGLRSQKTPPMIMGGEADALGNAGITTFKPGADTNGLLWWGPTSFLSLQDRLVQVLKAHTSFGSGDNSSLMFKPNSSSGEVSTSRSISPGKGYTVWRWGCDKLIFRFKPPIDDTVLPIDPLFLPSQLAHRFFHAYSVIHHPLNPIVSLDQVRASISDAYTGGVGFPPNAADRPSEHTRAMHKARDLLVLALGAQIEGGDGDAHCPKKVARAWSKQLADQAMKVLVSARENGSVDAIRLWLLYSVYLGNYGQVDEQYIATGRAARLATSLGLHRDPTCQLRQVKDENLRTLFWTTYILEKTVSLWQGRPSCLNIRGEIDTALPKNDNTTMTALRAMVDLVDSIDGIHRIYLNQTRDTSTTSACEKANAVLRELDMLRHSVPDELRGFEKVDPRATSRLLALDSPEGEAALLKFRLCLIFHNLRILATLPLLSSLVWQSITKQRESGNRQTCLDLAEQCVVSAETSISAFNLYMARIPYLPFMGDFTTMLLYAVPIIYLDCMRFDRDTISRRNTDALRMALEVLQHFDHPAGDICEAMIRDLFDNYLKRPDWSNTHMRSSVMNHPSSNNELLSWLTGPYDHSHPRTKIPP